MRVLTALALAAVTAFSASAAAAAPSARSAALTAGDWRKAAELGASAADVVRALQHKGRFADMDPAQSVVTIGADNGVEAVALKPLPPLAPADTASSGARTASLSGTGFTFTARAGTIVLYPDYAQAMFGPATAIPAGWVKP